MAATIGVLSKSKRGTRKHDIRANGYPVETEQSDPTKYMSFSVMFPPPSSSAATEAVRKTFRPRNVF